MDQDQFKQLNNRIDTLIAEIKALSKVTGMQLTRSFFLGLFYYLGATVGLAIFIALLGFLINLFGGLPVVGNWLIDLGRLFHK